MARSLNEAKKDFKVGYVYALKDFTAPKVWMGDFFECVYTDQRIKYNARFDGDYFGKPMHIHDFPHEIYQPERFISIIRNEMMKRKAIDIKKE